MSKMDTEEEYSFIEEEDDWDITTDGTSLSSDESDSGSKGSSDDDEEEKEQDDDDHELIRGDDDLATPVCSTDVSGKLVLQEPHVVLVSEDISSCVLGDPSMSTTTTASSGLALLSGPTDAVPIDTLQQNQQNKDHDGGGSSSIEGAVTTVSTTSDDIVDAKSMDNEETKEQESSSSSSSSTKKDFQNVVSSTTQLISAVLLPTSTTLTIPTKDGSISSKEASSSIVPSVSSSVESLSSTDSAKENKNEVSSDISISIPHDLIMIAEEEEKNKVLDSTSNDCRRDNVTAAETATAVTPFTTSKNFGGTGGIFFDSGSTNGPIQKITINAGAVVDGITVEYLKDHQVFVAGGCGGTSHSMTLDVAKGECITKVKVTYFKFVQSVTFITNMGRQLGPCGGSGDLFFCRSSTTNKGGARARYLTNTVTLCAPDDNDDTNTKYMLSGIKGRAGVYIDQIAFHWTPISMSSSSSSSSSNLDRNIISTLPSCDADVIHSKPCDVSRMTTQLYGGRGGTKFQVWLNNNKQSSSCQTISINAGNVVDGVTVMTTSTSSSSPLPGGLMQKQKQHHHIGGHGGSITSLTLKHNEYINEVHVTFNNRLVQCLLLKTNLGRQLGPCGRRTNGGGGRVCFTTMCMGGGDGGGGSRKVILKAPTSEHKLIGIHGRAGVYLDAVGLTWGSIH